MFGAINVHYDVRSEYVEPTVYSLRDQQRITNWRDVTGLTFRGEGLHYMRCLGLYHKSERPIVIEINLVFLYCPQCAFTPQHPCRTLFLVTHVRYIVVHQRGPVFYFDRVDVLNNYIDMNPLFLKISNTDREVPSVPSPFFPPQQPSAPSVTNSDLQPADRSSFQRRPSAHVPSSSSSSTVVQGSSRANALSVPLIVPPTEYDSDDSQVKKKTKVAALEWQGKTFYVTSKESAINILRDTYSVRSLMEEGQLQLLVNYVGDFVNNYTSDLLKTGIIRRNSKSALMAGMTLTMNANHGSR
jgi:hypothetical protein